MASDLNTSSFVATWTVDSPPYVILKWTIENLCCADSLLKSPCFEISPSSKWNLFLDPNVVVDGDEFIVIHLKRNHESEPGKLQLKGELSVHGASNELIYDKVFEETYDNGDSKEFRLAKVVFPLQLDFYLVRCEMVISCEINSIDTSSAFLEKLSMDYKQLYHDNRFTDISIRAIDDIIHAHKAILHARSPFWAIKLSENVPRLTDIEENSTYLAAILLFLYTGDPDLLLSSVPLEMFGKIYVIAKKWQLNELVNLLTPLRMQCKTHVRSEYFQYTWVIKNFTKQSAESSGILHSSEFSTKEFNSARWRLTIKRQLQDNGEFYGLYLEKVSSDSSLVKTNTEFEIYNSNGNSLQKKRDYIFAARANQKCGFPSIFDRGFLQNDSSSDDTLKVVCNLKIRLDTDSWTVFKSTSIDVSDKDKCSLKYLKIMSSNFRELYESKKYADIKLIAGNETIMAHKAVLYARSPYFSNILSQYSGDCIQIQIHHEIFIGILLYIYTSELPAITHLNMQQMYETSCFLKLEKMWSICKSYILLHVTVDNVLEIIVLAHRYEDRELEEAAEKFASMPANAKMFLNTQRWHTFRNDYTSLAIKIYHNLSWSFCNYF